MVAHGRAHFSRHEEIVPVVTLVGVTSIITSTALDTTISSGAILPPTNKARSKTQRHERCPTPQRDEIERLPNTSLPPARQVRYFPSPSLPHCAALGFGLGIGVGCQATAPAATTEGLEVGQAVGGKDRSGRVDEANQGHVDDPPSTGQRVGPANRALAFQQQINHRLSTARAGWQFGREEGHLG